MEDAKRFEKHFVIDASGCWLWESYKDKSGYGQVGLWGKILPAHRAAWYIYRYDEFDDTLKVLHADDCPKHCVNPYHSRVGSQKDNVADTVRLGRQVIPDNSGERHGRSKLTEQQVRQILARRAEGVCVLAKEYGITHSAISNILSGKAWKSIPRPG